MHLLARLFLIEVNVNYAFVELCIRFDYPFRGLAQLPMYWVLTDPWSCAKMFESFFFVVVVVVFYDTETPFRFCRQIGLNSAICNTLTTSGISHSLADTDIL